MRNRGEKRCLKSAWLMLPMMPPAMITIYHEFRHAVPELMRAGGAPAAATQRRRNDMPRQPRIHAGRGEFFAALRQERRRLSARSCRACRLFSPQQRVRQPMAMSFRHDYLMPRCRHADATSQCRMPPQPPYVIFVARIADAAAAFYVRFTFTPPSCHHAMPPPPKMRDMSPSGYYDEEHRHNNNIIHNSTSSTPQYANHATARVPHEMPSAATPICRKYFVAPFDAATAIASDEENMIAVAHTAAVTFHFAAASLRCLRFVSTPASPPRRSFTPCRHALAAVSSPFSESPQRAMIMPAPQT